MAIQFSVEVRNAMLDAAETAIGTSPTLELRTGSLPANTAASATGTLLASMTLPSDWMQAASAGAKALSGTWQDTSANAAGDIGYFTINQGATRHWQGTVTATGGGGDLTVASITVGSGQEINVTAFTLTQGNA